MRVSVVICTYNRADGLRATLESLRLQRHQDFEVVVVNGPSTDHTTTVLLEYGQSIKFVENPLANLSVSRNLGIRASAGDIVAFIDDDALPEPAWLEQALAAFDDPEVAGVGGIVFDHTGMSLQYRYSAATRFGEPTFSVHEPFDLNCLPGAATFPYVQGTNALFRRDRLAAIGLFDETFDFYLDETDVCCRLVDAGYVIRQLPNAPVHHKYLPSARRNDRKVVTNWSSIVRNHVYFGYRHALPMTTELEILEHARQFVDYVVADAEHHEGLGVVEPGHVERAKEASGRAIGDGIVLGRERSLLRFEPADLDPEPFKRYPTAGAGAMKILVVSSGYVPNLTGGIARFASDVAPELARRGHEVRVLARADEVVTVDLEDGVWVHRLLGTEVPGLVPEATAAIDSFATAVAREVERIEPWWRPDVVYGSLWDVEMLGLARAQSALPVVPMLATPVAEVAQHEGWTDPSHPFHDMLTRLVKLERELIARSASVHAISDAIVDTFERLYPGALHGDRIEVAHIGRADDGARQPSIVPTDQPQVLFVGRLEPRKGIDTFLAASRRLLAGHDNLRIVVAGDDRRPGPDGLTYPEQWERDALAAADRLAFVGLVDDAVLSELIDASTVVVMPSRYESFGLVVVEAMIHGRPVVASDVGGIAELIVDGVTGVRTPVGDDEQLAADIARIIAHPDLALSMGREGRRRYEDLFSAAAAAERLEHVLSAVVASRSVRIVE